ncbi:uncharacterized protein EV422DRAFT_484484, partial [Fimicolochytrium jonesii]|uniref:uncharacterized protein n=1 Tax=Fimicolochytrium jonesii TaxID=1396493 RepID=UPI0022FEF9F2
PTAHKAAPGKRRKLTPEEKEQRAKDRAIRNRQAAQDSRDKKRKYMDDLEATNAALQQHNANLAKRLEVTERSNFTLMSRLEDLASQFASISKRFKLTSSTDY